MIWTSSTGSATIVAPSQPAQNGPRFTELVAQHGVLGGIRQRLDGWRVYPPHGPIALYNTSDPYDSPTFDDHDAN